MRSRLFPFLLVLAACASTRRETITEIAVRPIALSGENRVLIETEMRDGRGEVSCMPTIVSEIGETAELAVETDGDEMRLVCEVHGVAGGSVELSVSFQQVQDTRPARSAGAKRAEVEDGEALVLPVR